MIIKLVEISKENVNAQQEVIEEEGKEPLKEEPREKDEIETEEIPDKNTVN